MFFIMIRVSSSPKDKKMSFIEVKYFMYTGIFFLKMLLNQLIIPDRLTDNIIFSNRGNLISLLQIPELLDRIYTSGVPS